MGLASPPLHSSALPTGILSSAFRLRSDHFFVGPHPATPNNKKNHLKRWLYKLERAMGSEPLFFYLIVFTKNTIFKNQDFRLNVTHFGHSMITPKLCESLHQIYSLSRGDSQKILFF